MKFFALKDFGLSARKKFRPSVGFCDLFEDLISGEKQEERGGISRAPLVFIGADYLAVAPLGRMGTVVIWA
jgi:hypothetical protein